MTLVLAYTLMSETPILGYRKEISMTGGRKAAALLLVGTALLLIGPAFKFLTVEGPGGKESITGYKLEEASPYVLAAVLIGISAIALFFLTSATASKVFGVIALLGALFAGYAAFVDITDVDSAVPAELRETVEANAGLGSWIVLVGAIIALVGAIKALMAGPSTQTTAPPAAPPPTATPPAP
jgi:hypothetical protein